MKITIILLLLKFVNRSNIQLYKNDNFNIKALSKRYINLNLTLIRPLNKFHRIKTYNFV